MSFVLRSAVWSTLAVVAGGATGSVLAVTPEQVREARDAVYPALVNISVVNERFAGGRTHRYPGAGSGVIVTGQGHVLTNFHVAGDTARIQCTLTDGRVFEARVLADDPLTDLSVLRLVSEADESFPFAELGRSGDLTVGQPVLAMGNPLALSSSMTQGIISNPARVFTDFTGSEMRELTLGEGNLSGLLTRWIQHDALILPGNSGGPLVDLEGKVIGINELGGRGMGFAIPSDIAAEVLRQVLDTGSIVRGWLGLAVLPVAKLGLDRGALVSTVLADSAADEAGLRPGDIIVELDGEPVSVRFFEEVPLLYERIARLGPEADFRLTVARDGQDVSLAGTTTAMQPFRGEEAELETLGATVRELTEPARLVRSLEITSGLIVTGINPGSILDRSRPRPLPDDVIVGLGRREISTLNDLEEALHDLDPQRDFLVELHRFGETLLSVAPPTDPDRIPFGGELPKAWVGLATQVLTPALASHIEAPTRTGYRVTRVLPWTEAVRAGFEAGDLLVALDGEPLVASRLQDGEDLRRRIEERSIGEDVTFGVVREGAEMEITVRLEERPVGTEDVDSDSSDWLDFSVRDITFLDRIRFRWEPEVAGVIVTEAEPGGWAHMAGLKLDDLVLEIADRPIENVEAFARVIRTVHDQRESVVKVFLRRGYRTHFVFLEPDWERAVVGGPVR